MGGKRHVVVDWRRRIGGQREPFDLEEVLPGKPEPRTTDQ